MDKNEKWTIENNKKCKIVINENPVSLIKTADEMFDELGFNKYEYNSQIEYLSRKRSHEIIFFENRKTIESRCGIGSEYISMQELKAINKKCEELGWL